MKNKFGDKIGIQNTQEDKMIRIRVEQFASSVPDPTLTLRV